MWFEDLMGFQESNPSQVRANLELEGTFLTSKVNGRTFNCGTLEVPTMAQLRERGPNPKEFSSQLKISQLVGNIRLIHQDPNNAGALFQAASQFNLLEMTGPQVIPEEGVGIYQYDPTQGPACAIACGAGTIFRNYFADVNGQIGQTRLNQIDCLEGIGKLLDNPKLKLWTMRNGYAFPHREGLDHITQTLTSMSVEDLDHLRSQLKIGLQWNTEVTLGEAGHLVSQAYCSALPVSYLSIVANKWEAFARLVLEATYEATFFAALQNFQKTGNPHLYLTLVGGGAFGNRLSWIFDAIRRSVEMFRNTPLKVQIVSYMRSRLDVEEFVNSF